MSKYRLHEIEGAVELFSSDPYIFRAAELYQITGSLRKEIERFNLYLVARRPRMSLIPSSLALGPSGESVTGVVEAQVGDAKHALPFKTMLPAQLRAARLGTHEYPFDFLHS